MVAEQSIGTWGFFMLGLQNNFEWQQHCSL